ncbi:MAG: lasso peptide biosynthesis B2 protein [Paucibacter sp.]|nr:lasso peptide biosynthesis B2 protein [Roseateles sp.]
MRCPMYPISSYRMSLASHVRACDCDGHVILLDLRHNRYLGIGETTSKALAGQVEGWPTRADHVSPLPGSEKISDAAQRLLSQGLLTSSPYERYPNTTIEEAAATLELDRESSHQAIGIRRFAQVLKSVAIAAWWMRSHSLHAIALAVTARRVHIHGPRSDSLYQMRAGTSAYEKVQPFVFTAREKCLLDSLALVGFLATEGAFPRWVIGVRTCPFGAHSWVQSGHTVLNDQHEYVRQFRPILVV